MGEPGIAHHRGDARTGESLFAEPACGGIEDPRPARTPCLLSARFVWRCRMISPAALYRSKPKIFRQKNFLQITVGTGYNSQSTGKEMIGLDRGSLSYTGFVSEPFTKNLRA